MKERDIIFNKYGGRCAYCGCELQKGWHVDHREPVERKYKYSKAYYKHKTTGEKRDAYDKTLWNLSEKERWQWKFVDRKLVPDGYAKPENDTLENKMPSCASCNINKHGFTLEEFRNFIAGFITSLNRDITQYKIAKRYGLIQETGIEVKFYFETYNQSKVA